MKKGWKDRLQGRGRGIMKVNSSGRREVEDVVKEGV